MYNEKEYVVIMTGDYTQLNWVSRFLRVSGVAATVRPDELRVQARLVVDSSKEMRARMLSREYVESCTRQRLINIRMEEVFNYDEDEDYAI